ncbi:bifunctional 4-hydroxy-2-oxoglutarate aldolase/2-dehydro-3-deoxy-phosphogluconate aldolase [Selenomonas sp. TAMA-11512]|uniref:bifunctional 4-hydroxy-2-oxoglutarate aldolase/2-dehydro-3-deoxy-phosphogluconate aldolase n=1 Tax=Selenomonas sp. TAMA-11512 TaxID=3095337 RepID=UPI00308C4108|nr:bifunctional 4-hydroxy-2-oxoglutarate aldolase/2-dehydro-3-deoxy-phosphogluconate aldolase [Selenomonas sp. TAMA-11512]
MQEKMILEKLLDHKIISIVRGVPADRIEATAEALHNGGIRCVEIAISHKSAEGIENTFASIRKVSEGFAGEMLIGAGTVLSPEEVRAAKDAGALYMISPNVDEEVIKETKRQGLVSMPGALSPTEVVSAYGWGADIIKVFPAGDFGAGYIKSLCAPLAHIPLAAVGGITAENMVSYLEAGAIGVGVGGNLANLKYIMDGNYDAITDMAKRFTTALREIMLDKGSVSLLY